MKRWQIIFASTYGPCDICHVGIRQGERIAWHPKTKQSMHAECFKTSFHPINTENAEDLTMSDANYLAEGDRLAEAGRIIRGETRMLATLEHLQALAQLVKLARIAVLARSLEQPDGPYQDWLNEANKLLATGTREYIKP